MKIHVVTEVTLTNDASNAHRLGSSLHRSVEQLLHGPDALYKTLFFMLSAMLKVALDSGPAPRWQELFSKVAAECLKRQEGSLQRPSLS